MKTCRPENQFILGRRGSSSGFTLIEMLVVMTILGILTVVTVTTLSFALDNSRINSAARSLQGALEGARDRASHAEEPRGIRLYYQTVEGRLLVNSISYIQATDPETSGTIRVERPDYYDNVDDFPPTAATPPPPGTPRYDYPVTLNSDLVADSDDPYVVVGDDVIWPALYQRGLLRQGTTIKIGDWWYVTEPVNGADFGTLANMSILHLAINYKNPTGAATDLLASDPTMEYQLRLAPVEMEGDNTSISMPEGTFIDLSTLVDNSVVPLAWGNIAATSSGQVDIMFSPLGPVDGPLSIHGLLHLPIVEIEDVINGITLGDEDKEGNEALVTVFTQTGQVASPPINIDATGSDPFQFARTGVTE